MSARTATEAALRRRLVLTASLVTVLATVHFADHVLRGRLVLDQRLDPSWNHSGWPFQARFSPFTISLVVVYTILLGGIALTLRGRAWAGYWLAAAAVLAAIVTQVHLVPGPNTESPAVILATYGNDLLGVPAVVVTFAIVASLLLLAWQALVVRRRSGRW
jgi:hypothetical protein